VSAVSAATEVLRARYQEGRLVPFIGAGASMAVSWEQDGVERCGISWSALVDQAARLLGYEGADMLRVRGTDLQILEYYTAKNEGQIAELRNWISSTFSAPDQVLADSPVHSAISKLVKCQVMYTTNYDNYIERSLRLAGRPATAVAVERHLAEVLKADAMGQGATTQVVKFHGDLNNPERMVLSERDYDLRMRLEDVEDRRLTADALGRAVLFIGYSFRDANVSYLFRLLNDTFGPLPVDNTGRRAYILIADPSDFEITLYRARNIEVIPIRSDFKTEDTAEILEGLAG
jgi:hypothetical protein